VIGAVHRFDLTAQGNRRALGQAAGGVLDDLLHIGRNAAQIAILGVA
jgi:hypothetical protein